MGIMRRRGVAARRGGERRGIYQSRKELEEVESSSLRD